MENTLCKYTRTKKGLLKSRWSRIRDSDFLFVCLYILARFHVTHTRPHTHTYTTETVYSVLNTNLCKLRQKGGLGICKHLSKRIIHWTSGLETKTNAVREIPALSVFQRKALIQGTQADYTTLGNWNETEISDKRYKLTHQVKSVNKCLIKSDNYALITFLLSTLDLKGNTRSQIVCQLAGSHSASVYVISEIKQLTSICQILTECPPWVRLWAACCM